MTKREQNQVAMNEVYDLNLAAITVHIAALQAAVAAMQTKPADLHWGHVGDLQRIRGALEETLGYATGNYR